MDERLLYRGCAMCQTPYHVGSAAATDPPLPGSAAATCFALKDEPRLASKAKELQALLAECKPEGPLARCPHKLLALKPLHVAPGRLTADLQMACYLIEKRSLIYRNCQSLLIRDGNRQINSHKSALSTACAPSKHGTCDKRPCSPSRLQPLMLCLCLQIDSGGGSKD